MMKFAPYIGCCMVAIGLLPMASCSAQKPPTPMESTSQPVRASVPADNHFRGLYDRVGDAIVDADPEDVACARRYAEFPDKGAMHQGMRLTIEVPRRSYAVGESVHVLHFVELALPEGELHIMGPKPVFGEQIDGVMRTSPPETNNYPWVALYDGEVMPGPGVDYNFEITKYTFDTPGVHRILWQVGAYRSNLLEISVR